MYIKLTSIPVSDPVAAHAFYTEVLGLESHTFMPEAQLAIVTSKDCRFTLMLEPNGHELSKNLQTGAYALGMPILILGCSDVEAEYQRLLQHDVKFKDAPKKTDWGTMAIFEDGFGNYIQIHED